MGCFDPHSVLVHGKRRLRRLFWRVRAHIKRKIKASRSSNKKNFNFNYDPLSYSLNFDDGNCVILLNNTNTTQHKILDSATEKINSSSTGYYYLCDEDELECLVSFLLCLVLDPLDFLML